MIKHDAVDCIKCGSRLPKDTRFDVCRSCRATKCIKCKKTYGRNYLNNSGFICGKCKRDGREGFKEYVSG